jgi:four helix bundle protein
MTKIESYRDLLVWQKGMDIVESVYRLTDKLPTDERWGLNSQMRRAAVSIPANIAEGYGRQATGEYRHHLSIARGSLLELETHLLVCQRLGLLTTKETGFVLDEIQQLSKMFAALISKLR